MKCLPSKHKGKGCVCACKHLEVLGDVLGESHVPTSELAEVDTDGEVEVGLRRNHTGVSCGAGEE